MANVNVRIDEGTKKRAEAVFEKLGLTPTTAINLFYVQVARTNSIPFELKLDVPNETTIKAIEEVEEMDKNPSKAKTFKNVDDLMEDLLK
jgi:DNA-damage-inducible protein J